MIDPGSPGPKKNVLMKILMKKYGLRTFGVICCLEESLELMQFVESDGFMKVMNPRDGDSFDFGVAAGIRPIKRWRWMTKKVVCFLPSNQCFLQMLLGNVFFCGGCGQCCMLHLEFFFATVGTVFATATVFSATATVFSTTVRGLCCAGCGWEGLWQSCCFCRSVFGVLCMS